MVLMSLVFPINFCSPCRPFLPEIAECFTGPTFTVRNEVRRNWKPRFENRTRRMPTTYPSIPKAVQLDRGTTCLCMRIYRKCGCP